MAKRKRTKHDHDCDHDLSSANPQNESVSTEVATPPIIVGVGASAGGLESLLRLFSSFQSLQDFAFVVVQHLDPDHESQTANILARATSIPVESIQDGTRVKPNCIYVIPPNTGLTLRDNVLKLTPRERLSRHRVIDDFFISLAKEREAASIGVILSGTGKDGTAGLTAIKAEGGTTLVQDPASAKFDGMPQSAIKAGVADLVLSPKAIAEALTDIAKRIRRGEAIVLSEHAGENELVSHELLQRIYFLLKAHTQIDCSSYKPSTVLRRLQRQMRELRLDDLESYVEHLQNHPDAVKELSDQMFIHVTEFFRDTDSFDALKETVFPSLLKDRIGGVPIRVWIPGCSTGEEPYSLAISLLEFLGVDASTTPIQIFATDISEAAIQEARSGLYTERQIETVSEARRKKYFDKLKEGWKVKKTVRDICIFSRHDITSSPPFAKIDLISCRNVLIYFSPELQKQVMPIFHYALNPNGFLWLGRSETPTGFNKFFTLIDKTHKVFSKINMATPINLKLQSGKPLTETVPPVKKVPAHIVPPIDSQKEFDRIVMSRYAPAGVMVNSAYEVLQVRGHTGPFMELPSGQPTYNLLKMLRPELLPSVRVALQSAVRENTPVRKEGLSYTYGKERKQINIEVIPANMMAPQPERQYLVLFEESPLARKRASRQKPSRAGVKGGKNGDPKEAYIRQLLDEMDAMREYHQSLIEGYEAAQEELTSANEELQSANEELQSLNEEMETAKEELQAANEEMTTVNEELQTRNVELTALNEKLAVSEERFRLLVSAVKDYAIFMLDPEGRVATWNEGARTLKGYQTSEVIGRHFSIFYPQEAIAIQFPQKELQVAIEVGRFEDEGWRIRKDGSKFWANVVITRINNSQGKLLGFAKVTRDLTERREAERRFRLLIEGVKDYAIYGLDPTGRITSWNEGARRVKGYSAEQVIGQNFSVFYTDEDIKSGRPAYDLKMATSVGRHEDEGWRVRKDGTQFWANTIITRIDDEDGKLIGFSKVTRDLTDRKRMEDEIRRSRDELEHRVKERTRELEDARTKIAAEKQKLYTLFMQAPAPIAVMEGSSQTYTFANEAYRKMINQRDVLGKPFKEVFPELVGTEVLRDVEESFSHAKRFETHDRLVKLKNPQSGRMEERYFTFILQPVLDSRGTIESLMNIGFEVTSEVLARKAVLESENQLRAFANSIPQLAWIADADGFIDWYNDRWYQYTGTTPGEMEGWGWQTVHDPRELPRVMASWKRSLESGEPFDMEFPLRGADRKFRWFLTRVNAYRDASGTIVKWFGTNTDIDEQRRIREQLSETLNARDEFLSISSHELKTPLTALKLQLQMARRTFAPLAPEIPSGHDLVGSFDLAIRQANSLASLVEDLLDISRIQTGNFSLNLGRMNLATLVKEVISRFAEQIKVANSTIELRLKDSVDGTWDRHRLEQVVVNLISNAIKYAPKSPIHIEALQREDTAILVVQDFGPGIPKDVQPKIFQRFERAGASKSVGGLGLGLFIVKKIVEAHGGTIVVESAENEGAKFTVALPLNPHIPLKETE
ncbi:MAG: PAS domain S-box protein [Bdellovibrionales bacterium]